MGAERLPRRQCVDGKLQVMAAVYGVVLQFAVRIVAARLVVEHQNIVVVVVGVNAVNLAAESDLRTVGQRKLGGLPAFTAHAELCFHTYGRDAELLAHTQVGVEECAEVYENLVSRNLPHHRLACYTARFRFLEVFISDAAQFAVMVFAPGFRWRGKAVLRAGSINELFKNVMHERSTLNRCDGVDVFGPIFSAEAQYRSQEVAEGAFRPAFEARGGKRTIAQNASEVCACRAEVAIPFSEISALSGSA